MKTNNSMITLSSPHVHTPYCDGKSTAREMVEQALALGFVSLGFSSHAKQDFDLMYALDEEGEAQYIQEIKALQAEFQGQIRIWLGMERDYYAIAQRDMFDYVLASVHYVRAADGNQIPVDGTPQMVQAFIDNSCAGDGLILAEAYYALLGKYIREYQPDIIGHFDLLMKNNYQNALFDSESARYKAAATNAMDEAIKGCRMLEINTGGILRSKAPVPYPTLPLLSYWRAIGGEVILSSDCHHKDGLNAAYPQAVELIKKAGFKEAAILGRHDALFERFPVESV